MPNRNTFDDREKYDHSGHRTTGREKGDLAPAPNQVEESTKTKHPPTADPVPLPSTPQRR
jgi:hypothetical protein